MGFFEAFIRQIYRGKQRQLPRLLFVTNPRNSNPGEDRFLVRYLRGLFDITVVDPKRAVERLPEFSRVLIRNAWPSRLFEKEFRAMREIIMEQGIRSYNPFHRNGFIEDKEYLLHLFRAGYPVIPSVDLIEDLELLGSRERYVIKPKDGCSSYGVKVLTKEELLRTNLAGYIVQPEIDFVDEISLYFIDGIFVYAMVSAGKGKRWNLQEYPPTQIELEWAQDFVDWNALPYGLQRIDGCRLRDGSILLMEVEDTMPMLTLRDLSPISRGRVLKAFSASLLKNLRDEELPAKI